MYSKGTRKFVLKELKSLNMFLRAYNWLQKEKQEA